MSARLKNMMIAASIIFDIELFEDLDRWGKSRTLIELYSGVLPKNHFSNYILLRIKKFIYVLGNLGFAYSALGQVEKAIQYYEKALAIAQEIGDRRNEGRWLGYLGSAYSDLGQIEKAIQYYEQALAIAREIGDRRNEGGSRTLRLGIQRSWSGREGHPVLRAGACHIKGNQG